MSRESPEIIAARRLAQQASGLLAQASSFSSLPLEKRAELMRDLKAIQTALGSDHDPYTTVQQSYSPVRDTHTASKNSSLAHDPYALSLATPLDLRRRRTMFGETAPGNEAKNEAATEMPSSPPRPQATETLAARAGALSDEIDFPAFVAGLIHGTFDAIVDASIRQMEAFAELVSAVAKDVERFTVENVTPNQVRDWLVQEYPRDLVLDLSSEGPPRVVPRKTAEDGEPNSPIWLGDYGLDGEELTEELIEETVIPLAQRRVGESRQQLLATMVLLGMNRVVVRDGTIETRVRFRAAARDSAKAGYAASQDPGGKTWGNRGGGMDGSAMMVSTVGVNVQSETDLKVELFGAVKINFVSETLPLDRFVDAAQLTLLQRNARPSNAALTAPAPPPEAPSTTPPTTPLITPTTPERPSTGGT